MKHFRLAHLFCCRCVFFKKKMGRIHESVNRREKTLYLVVRNCQRKSWGGLTIKIIRCLKLLKSRPIISTFSLPVKRIFLKLNCKKFYFEKQNFFHFIFISCSWESRRNEFQCNFEQHFFMLTKAGEKN